ncbi:hypothetical protein RRG08_037054 [Elysia crispata]|uniref:Fucolectin tachylectin-4 pentraxin-1 domain-containing protein n=1 Tax=Elysia crispata TaxID=231223 RepID=A0AAE0YAH8_9GAST|nr:hypothetical protein RRG08_037054 [Elysia crispata]
MKAGQVTSMLLALVLVALVSNTPCDGCEAGWFGSQCEFQCHCATEGECCGIQDGFCSSGCHPEWFGPGCQYFSMNFTAAPGSASGWLTDRDDATCNQEEGGHQTITVTLDTPIPVSRIRVVLTNAGLLSQLAISYQLESSRKPSRQENASELRSIKVDDTTMDIFYNSPDIVANLTLSGKAVKELCSLYISGGRNMALKQATEQSSLYLNWHAAHAVDGRPETSQYYPSHFEICTHTPEGEAGWWRVIFQHPVEVSRILVYNRGGDCLEGLCADRLVNFSMAVQTQTTDGINVRAYTYRDPGGPGQDVYTVIPSPRISSLVSEVRIDVGPGKDILTLCEVQVFGDCPLGTYGFGCSERCSPACMGPQQACGQLDGACDQCNPGYTGKHCDKTCPRGTHGPGCNRTCSARCAGPDNPCHHVDGSCYLGCVEDDTSFMCRSALSRHIKFERSRLSREQHSFRQKAWTTAGAAIVAVAAIAAVVIGVVVWRFQKAFKKETQSAGTNHLSNGLELGPVGDEPEAGSETLPRAEEACSEDDPQQHYHTTVPDPQDVHVYHSGCGVYANNAHILRQSNTYLIPDRKTDTYEPDFYEVKQSSASADTSDTATYSNLNRLMNMEVDQLCSVD